MERFLELYAKLPGDVVAVAVRVATGVDRPAATIRGWARDARAGKGLPDWVIPQLPVIIRALEAEVERAERVTDVV